MAQAVTISAGSGAGTSPPSPSLLAPPSGYPRDDLISFTCGTGTSPTATAASGTEPAFYILAVINFGGGYTGLQEATRPVIQAIPRNGAAAGLGTPFVKPSTNNSANLCVLTAPAASQANTVYDYDVIVTI